MLLKLPTLGVLASFCFLPKGIKEAVSGLEAGPDDLLTIHRVAWVVQLFASCYHICCRPSDIWREGGQYHLVGTGGSLRFIYDGRYYSTGFT